MPVDGLAETTLWGWVGNILSALALIPYFGWGIYTLRLRYRYHEELSLATEVVTLLAVVAFNFIELFLLRAPDGVSVTFIFAILGLTASAAALYGPMVISLLSRLLVDFVLPPEASSTHEPRYAPAEALERAMDYEGAVREYMAIARIFPREPTAYVRIGGLYMKLDAPEDAAEWFERALPFLDSPEGNLEVLNRACEIYTRRLEKPSEAVRLLEEFLERFPESDYVQSVRFRIERLKS